MAARRTARSSNAPRQLSEHQIIQAALRLARKVGTENVSMRALSAELRVSPMAIYYHVPNKGALLDLVVDAVLSQVPTPAPDPARWQEQLKEGSMAAFHLLAGYPGLSGVMLMRGNTKVGRALVRHGIAVLLAAGFDQRQAALGIAAYNTYMYGLYAGLNAMSRPKAKKARARVNGKRKEREPGLGEVVEQLRALGVVEAIDFGIDAMLSGIASLAQSEPRAKPALARRARVGR
jgi:AcrR family transcriptional regulator